MLSSPTFVESASDAPAVYTLAKVRFENHRGGAITTRQHCMCYRRSITAITLVRISGEAKVDDPQLLGLCIHLLQVLVTKDRHGESVRAAPDSIIKAVDTKIDPMARRYGGARKNARVEGAGCVETMGFSGFRSRWITDTLCRKLPHGTVVVRSQAVFSKADDCSLLPF